MGLCTQVLFATFLAIIVDLGSVLESKSDKISVRIGRSYDVGVSRNAAVKSWCRSQTWSVGEILIPIANASRRYKCSILDLKMPEAESICKNFLIL